MSSNPLPEKLWEHDDVKATKIYAFMQYVNKNYRQQISSYDELWRWSTKFINDFWMSVWNFTGVNASVHPTFAISPSDAGRMYPVPAWFPEAKLNFAQNILESTNALLQGPHRTAVTGVREGGLETEHISLSELRNKVGRLANALIRSGVKPLDRVACIGSNSIDTFVIFLAVVSIGATFTCCSPELGSQSILDRFVQTEPKVLFADDWTVYNGKRASCMEKIVAVAKELRAKAKLERLILVPRFAFAHPNVPDGAQYLSDFVAGAAKELCFTQTVFSHPMVIVYSSGTTGPPKCIVHTVGGVLMKQKKEQILCLDMDIDSVYLQYSSTNWIMYLYSVNGLLSGARSILYDGSPLKPSALGFLQLLAREGVTHFGTSAHYLSILEGAGITSSNLPKMEQLKCITSTGSVLVTSQYHWVYSTFGRVQLSSIAGGTDIAGAFVRGAPNVPIYAGWCQARTLGMKVQIFSHDGRPVEDTGDAGELVCTAPFPSQPAFFWNDDGGKKYQNAYFTKFPGIWHQGDYIQMHPNTKGIQFLGRSDGVLNPSGVRFGSAEIYNAIAYFSQIEDSLCIGQRRPQDRDEQVLLFVKLKPSAKFTRKLENEIRQHIRQQLSARHVPRYIFECPAIPMTINGKKTELPIKKLICGQALTVSSMIANPESLDWFKRFVNVEEYVRQLAGEMQMAKL